MAYAFVNEAGNDSASSVQTITVTYAPTAGNLLTFAIVADSADTTTVALSDNLGVHNTFTQISTSLNSASSQMNWFYYAANCKGGSTIFTADFSTLARFRGIYVAEYSGIATSSPFLNGTRNEQNSPGGTTDAITSTNANATSQPALVWGLCIDNSGATWPTAGTSYTGRGAMWSTNTCTLRGEDKRVTATGNVAATFTAGTGTDDFVTAIGIFLETTTPTVQAQTLTQGTFQTLSMRR